MIHSMHAKLDASQHLYDADLTIVMFGTADELLEQPVVPGQPVWVYFDAVAGYIVHTATPGTHDGREAVTVQLRDSLGSRSVGRATFCIDGTRDSLLKWERVFETPEDAVKYHDYMQGRQQANVPDGFVQLPARALLSGSVIALPDGDRVTVDTVKLYVDVRNEKLKVRIDGYMREAKGLEHPIENFFDAEEILAVKVG